eukprot:gene568-3885_t
MDQSQNQHVKEESEEDSKRPDFSSSQSESADSIRAKRISRLASPNHKKSPSYDCNSSKTSNPFFALMDEKADNYPNRPSKLHYTYLALSIFLTCMSVHTLIHARTFGHFACHDISLRSPQLSRSVSTPVSKQSNTKQQPIYVYAHNFIKQVLGVIYMEQQDDQTDYQRTFSYDRNTDQGRLRCCYLLSELESDPELDPRKLVDTIVMAHLSSDDPLIPKSIEYLSQCYTRAKDKKRTLPPSSSLHELADVVLELSLSYTCTILQVDAPIFPVNRATENPVNWISSALLTKKTDRDFLSAVVDSSITEDASIIDKIFLPALSSICNLARDAKDIQDVTPMLQAFKEACTLGTVSKGEPLPIAHALVMHPNFLPSEETRDGLEQTPFGAFLVPGVIPEAQIPTFQLSRSRFSASGMFPVQQQKDYRWCTSDIANIIASLSHPFSRFMQETPEERNRVFNFFGCVARVNNQRAQLASSLAHAQLPATNTDNFMMNLVVLMEQLCSKLITFDSSRMQVRFCELDVRFIALSDNQLCHDKVTSLGATEEEVRTWKETMLQSLQESPMSDKSLTVSRQLFTTLHFLHFGLFPAISRMDNTYRTSRSQLAFLNRQLEAARHAGLPTARFEMQLDQLIAERLAMETDLLSESPLADMTDFFGFFAAWLLYKAGFGGSDDLLPDTIPSDWKHLPEYFAFDVIEFLLYISRNQKQLLSTTPASPVFMKFIVSFLLSSKHIKIPSERAKLVEVLANLLPEHTASSPFLSALLQSDLGTQYLGPALMKFYVDAEEIDYYARPGVRYNLQLVLKQMWEIPRCREAIIQSTKENGFVRFVMLLINDTTLLFDDVFDVLVKIRDMKSRLAQSEEWNNPDQTRDAAERELQQLERQAKIESLLATETLHFFDYLSEAVVEPFLRREVVGRLAGMLNSNIRWLFGPQGSTLEPELLQQYSLNPIELLRKLIAIYLHCSCMPAQGAQQADVSLCFLHHEITNFDHTDKQPVFVNAIINDARYDATLLRKAIAVLKSSSASYDVIRQVELLLSKFEDAFAEMQSEEADLGDIPEQYLDPVMYTLMKDPVQLPSSKAISRKILEHLLSDPTDPFNRSKLSPDMLIPEPELKAEIDAWVASRKRESKDTP